MLKKLQDESEKVLKKQRISSSNVAKHIDSLLQSIEISREALAAKDLVKPGHILRDTNASAQVTVSKITKEFKVYHAAVSKFGKSIEKKVCPETKNTAGKVLPTDGVNRIAAEHFCRQGRFEIAATFEQEASLEKPLRQTMIASFAEIHETTKAMLQKDLKPALQWVHKYQDHANLAASRVFLSLHFELVRLRFIQLLCLPSAPIADALDFGRREFPRFAVTELKGIQRLMGCLMFSGRLPSSPYKDLLAEEHWYSVSSSLLKCCCRMNDVADSSPLEALVETGIAALPTLVKVLEMMKSGAGEGSADEATLWDADELPVAVPLVSRKRQHHSVFSCPVSREQSTVSNPPVLLKCGHVICRNTMQKFTETNRRWARVCCVVSGQKFVLIRILHPQLQVSNLPGGAGGWRHARGLFLSGKRGACCYCTKPAPPDLVRATAAIAARPC
jgi:hypothetical protein